MRIEHYAQIQQLYGQPKVNKANKTTTTSFSDQLQISSIGKDIQTAKSAVANSKDIRENLTAPIKEAVQNGTYDVDSSSFADKLLEKYYEMR